ncbi:type II secretion system protein GspC [Alteromonas facilis]|uniref:type II secretion system protein GspC n=1 Tax=Alteromonas facilis TaxID=2048004 RepID=UPI000C283B62|nr:type II secretion system protein GspC [Alteromonas facilis]
MPTLQSATHLIQQRQSSIRFVVVCLLALYLLAFLAQLIWRVIPTPESINSATQPAVVTATGSTASARVNLSRIKNLQLFGRFNPQVEVQQPTQTVTDAPETKLNLVLTGVVATTEQDAGAAIIAYRNAQQTYGIGEKIEGTNASLQEVFADRVIIRNGARNETLMLDGVDFDEANKKRSQSATTSSTRTSTPTSRPALSDSAIAATQQLRSQPTKFTDFLSISPAQADGELLGYRVQPGKNPALFEAAGLTAGDVITEINGLDVTDPQQAREAMGELQTADSLQLTVLRDEQYLTLYLDLPEPSDEE